MDRFRLYGFLSQQRYGVVSSTAANGTPQSALVGIAVTPDLEIVFDTLASTRKYGNLVAKPACSMVIGWDGEETVQLEGNAELLAGPALERYLPAYFARWPECVEHTLWPGIAYFVVRPRWIRYSDYGQRPPSIEEIALGA